MRSHYDSSAVSFDKNSRMPYMNERRKTLQIYQRGLEARGNKKLSSPDPDITFNRSPNGSDVNSATTTVGTDSVEKSARESQRVGIAEKKPQAMLAGEVFRSQRVRHEISRDPEIKLKSQEGLVCSQKGDQFRQVPEHRSQMGDNLRQRFEQSKSQMGVSTRQPKQPELKTQRVRSDHERTKEYFEGDSRGRPANSDRSSRLDGRDNALDYSSNNLDGGFSRRGECGFSSHLNYPDEMNGHLNYSDDQPYEFSRIVSRKPDDTKVVRDWLIKLSFAKFDTWIQFEWLVTDSLDTFDLRFLLYIDFDNFRHDNQFIPSTYSKFPASTMIQWQKIIRNAVVKALGPHQMALIKFGRYNLTELWGKLQTHYNVDKRYRQQEIHRTIDDMRFTAGTDFRVFCGKFMSLIDEYRLNGGNITENDAVYYFGRSLPPPLYRTLPSFDDMKYQRQVDHLKRWNGARLPRDATAMAVRTDRRMCYKCKKPGHVRAQCPQSMSVTQSGQSKSPVIKRREKLWCHICG